MRFMLIVKADKNSEAGNPPDEKILGDMANFNEQMLKAGVMLAGEGLQPSSRGSRVYFSGGKTRIVDGPFAESKELVGGFWLIQAKSKAEAIEWAKRAPFVDAQVEIRQVFELEDFSPSKAVEHHARNKRTLEGKR